jgi:uncharacterized cupredoxin-like copper-binding protein
VTVRRRLLPVLCGAALCAIATASAQTPQTPLITLVLTDHHFRLSAPIEAGRLTWHVKNEGTEPHQALVVRLPDGISEYGERAWFDHGGQGPEPGERAGGIERIAPGAAATFDTTLKPGKYLLLCTMAEDEGRHYELGMIYRFTIE